MSIGLKTLIDCVNTSITNADTSDYLEILQLSSVVRDFDQGFVYSVANTASLPAAANNKGRLVYVTANTSFRISDGTAWSNNFTSTIDNTLLFGFGRNNGRLGNNNTTARCSPVSVVGGFTDWCQVGAGANHSLGVRCNGSLWAWGVNFSGNLGNGNTSDRCSPVSVIGGFTDWCRAAAAPDYHSAGIRRNGTLWSWGYNGRGRIGDGTETDRCSPVSVIGGFTDWSRVTLSLGSPIALRSNGTIWGWGCNRYGEVGDNTLTPRSSPVSVVGGFTDWCNIGSGIRHSLGIRTNGTAWAWGRNTSGELGDNTSTDRSSPVSVVGGFTDWCQVVGGSFRSFGIRTNGTLWAWGSNGYGRLGDNTTTTRSSPVSVVGGFTDWCQVTSGESASHALRTNGTLWVWGTNGFGQFGTGEGNICRSSPILSGCPFTDWCQVSSQAQGQFALAIRSTRGFAAV